MLHWFRDIFSNPGDILEEDPEYDGGGGDTGGVYSEVIVLYDVIDF